MSRKAVENGIDIIRCFDALNDLRNMQTAVKATKKYGGTAEIAMSYTESPVHNEDYFVKLAVDIQKMGADVICIKDMANPAAALQGVQPRQAPEEGNRPAHRPAHAQHHRHG